MDEGSGTVSVTGSVACGVAVGIKGSVAVGRGVEETVTVGVETTRVTVGAGERVGVLVAVGCGVVSCRGINKNTTVSRTKIRSTNNARSAVRRASSRIT